MQLEVQQYHVWATGTNGMKEMSHDGCTSDETLVLPKR